MRLIPHLVEIHEKYGPQGLTVLALSGQGQGTLEPFVTEKAMPYMVGYGDRSPYGVSGIPDAYLVGADGTVVWQGHPSGLTNATIEAELAKVNMLPDLDYSKAFKSILKDLTKDKYGKAMGRLEKLLEKSDDETDIDHANQLVEYINGKAAALQAEAEALASQDNYFLAAQRLEFLADNFDDMEAAETAEETLDAWKDDDAIEDLIDAGELFEMGKVFKRERQMEKAAAAFAKAIKKAPDSQIAAAAQAQLESMQNSMRR